MMQQCLCVGVCLNLCTHTHTHIESDPPTPPPSFLSSQLHVLFMSPSCCGRCGGTGYEAAGWGDAEEREGQQVERFPMGPRGACARDRGYLCHELGYLSEERGAEDKRGRGE